jgi:hypothetical protein
LKVNKIVRISNNPEVVKQMFQMFQFAHVPQIERMHHQPTSYIPCAHGCMFCVGPQMDHLSTLHVSNSTVHDLAPIATLVSISCLHLTDIQEGEIDLTPLSALRALQEANFAESKALVDIAPLAQIRGLKELDAIGTRVINLLPLQPHANLTTRAATSAGDWPLPPTPPHPNWR